LCAARFPYTGGERRRTNREARRASQLASPADLKPCRSPAATALSIALPPVAASCADRAPAIVFAAAVVPVGGIVPIVAIDANTATMSVGAPVSAAISVPVGARAGLLTRTRPRASPAARHRAAWGSRPADAGAAGCTWCAWCSPSLWVGEAALGSDIGSG
jgi:hypothetical protein